MRVHDPFEHDDAAYVLDALPAAERAAYERHLAGCPECRGRVESLRSIADGLGRLEAADVADVVDVAGVGAERSDVPAGELPLLLAAVERQRRRRTWAVRVLGGLAAAAVAALIVALSVPGSPAPERSTAAAHAMTALVPSPVTAQVSLQPTRWGTAVAVRCRYLTVSGYPGAGVYDLVVVDRAGHRHALGSWTLSAGSRASFSSPVALSADAIRLVQVTTAGGTPILQLET